MRKILFRAKRIDTGEWVEGCFYTSRNNYSYILINLPDNAGFTVNGSLVNWIKVIPETVGQYTGLKDRTGREIYEGDVDEQGDVVVFATVDYETEKTNGDGYLYSVTGWHWKGRRSELLPVDESNKVKIIGNIHDNPELLEVQG